MEKQDRNFANVAAAKTSLNLPELKIKNGNPNVGSHLCQRHGPHSNKNCCKLVKLREKFDIYKEKQE